MGYGGPNRFMARRAANPGPNAVGERPSTSVEAPARLAVVSSEFPPKWGGVGNYTYHLVEAVAPSWPGTIEVLARNQDGVEVPLPPRVCLQRLPFLPLPMVFALSFGQHATEELCARRADRRPDVVHVMSNMTLLPRQAYERLEMPVVSTMHGTWHGERQGLQLSDVAPTPQGLNDLAVLGLSPLFDRYEDFAIENSDRVTVQSANELREVQARIKAKGLHPRGTIIEVSPGVDTHTYSPAHRSASLRRSLGISDDQLLVLCVARLAGRKGLEELVRAFAAVSARVPLARLVLVGDGPLRGRLEAVARTLGCRSKVRFIGAMPIARLAELYASADLFMLLSRWEGFGLVPMEAMASGVPVVSTGVGGIPEYVREETDGILVPVGSIDAAAQAATELLQDPNRREQMGIAAREGIVTGHSWEVVAQRFIAIYRDLLAR